MSPDLTAGKASAVTVPETARICRTMLCRVDCVRTVTAIHAELRQAGTAPARACDPASSLPHLPCEPLHRSL